MSCPIKSTTLPSSFGLGYNPGYNPGYQQSYSGGGGMNRGSIGKIIISSIIILLGLIAYTSYTIYMINGDKQGDLEETNIAITAAASAIIFTLIFSYTIDRPFSLGFLALGIIAYSAYTIDMVKKEKVGDLKTTAIWILSISCVLVTVIVGMAVMNPGILRM